MNKIATCAAAVATLIGAPAFAADMAVKMPVKAPPPAPAPVFSWTGFYVGVHGGGAWFAKDWFFPCTTTNAVFGSPCGVSENGHTGSGWLAGGQVGFNYQISQWVWGVESQFSATRIEGSNVSPFFSLRSFTAAPTSSEPSLVGSVCLGTARYSMQRAAELGE